MPEHGVRALRTNVNTRFFQELAPEFDQGARSQAVIRKFKKTATAKATGTSLSKRFNV